MRWEFGYTTTAQQIIFGAGAVTRLVEVVAPYDWQRLMLCTTPHLRENGSVDGVVATLGNQLVAIYEEVEPHVPGYQVKEAVALAVEQEVEAVIGLGGGSAIGMAKAVSMTLEARRSGRGEARAAYPTQQPLVPSVAIPTTYAGSEMTPVYGVTHTQPDGSTRKVTVRDEKVTPKVALYDPELTLSLPPALTASTGINALAHCIEAVYSRTRNPLSTSAALRGIYHISRSLARCYAHGNELEARTEMQIGAHLGGTALATVEMGLHHGTGHVLGGTAGVPHGIANCIVLPHAIRFNATAVAPQLALAAEAMGIDHDGKSDEALAYALADHLYDLIGQLEQPQRLRDVGVPRDLLPRLAENMLKSKAIANNPKPLTSVEQALAYLEAMW
ncbi:MAG: iron-containing alcohol dehydrogenase [Chloroflexota bacterium]|nr:iron-containing alcohol dehydrogenase [Chloroflexota bacterium]